MNEGFFRYFLTSQVYVIDKNMTQIRSQIDYVIKYTLESNNMLFEENLTRQSSHENDWSQEHQVYYYSRFDLFNSELQQQFYHFTTFGARVSAELGDDWSSEAAMLYYPHISSRQVFVILLELWLRHHPPVNSMSSVYQKTSTFNPEYLVEFKKMTEKMMIPFGQGKTIKPPASSLKAVCLGFYMTANQIWQELFQNTNKRQNVFTSNNFFKGVSLTLEKTFKPLMVVTKKISSVFGHKKRKLNSQNSMTDSQEPGFENCYQQFLRTLDMQRQLQRKMSDLCLDDEEIIKKSQKKVIERKSFKEQDSPMKPSIMSTVYTYVTDFLQNNPSWQVASNFVTQIMELNQFQMSEDMKVRVMRPAQEFYRKLVLVWLLCQQNTSEKITFQIYLRNLQATFFSESWQSKFYLPTQYFFQKMTTFWDQIKQDNESTSLTEKSVLASFISKITGSMNEDWNRKLKFKG